MALHGLDPDKNNDAATFAQLLPRRIAASGAAAVSLDHVTKSREGRGRWAIGAQHKLSGLDGASYVLDNRTPFGVGLTGRTTVRIAKDRPGQLRRNALPSSEGMFWFGDLALKSRDDTFAEVSVEPPFEREDSWRPTKLMSAIASLLEERGALSQRRILAGVRGKTDRKREALDLLIVDGYVSDKTPHELLKPYLDQDGDQ
ncbi:hypothetical protein [Solicola gregarius]|uniref:Uncharacterized protein n=1 Tax=Solicola gregarius TaxID=2908642 RepID=A0AA46TDS1_9ACTN|nr:hypothetical protein [Solicola gregarius]UYM03444.1 hypothetical protein L0C25_12845 [Solicola gregarius]